MRSKTKDLNITDMEIRCRELWGEQRKFQKLRDEASSKGDQIAEEEYQCEIDATNDDLDFEYMKLARAIFELPDEQKDLIQLMIDEKQKDN